MICLCAGTRRAARLLTQMYGEALRPVNLTAAQFELLATLGCRGGISQSALADELAVDQTTLSRNLKPLLVRSLIQGATSSNDRRRTTYTLTERGDELMAAAMPLWGAVHAEMRRRLGGRWDAAVATMAEVRTATSLMAQATQNSVAEEPL